MTIEEDTEVCPICRGEIVRDEVDIGVGTMYGPWHCTECGWYQGQELDRMFHLKLKEEL